MLSTINQQAEPRAFKEERLELIFCIWNMSFLFMNYPTMPGNHFKLSVIQLRTRYSYFNMYFKQFSKI